DRVTEVRVLIAAEQGGVSGDLLRNDGVGHRVQLPHELLTLRVGTGERIPLRYCQTNSGDASVGAVRFRSFRGKKLVDQRFSLARVSRIDVERREITALSNTSRRDVDLRRAIPGDGLCRADDR